MTLSNENYSRINNIILHAASKYSKILLYIEQTLFIILIQKIYIEYCIANMNFKESDINPELKSLPIHPLIKFSSQRRSNHENKEKKSPDINKRAPIES